MASIIQTIRNELLRPIAGTSCDRHADFISDWDAGIALIHLMVITRFSYWHTLLWSMAGLAIVCSDMPAALRLGKRLLDSFAASVQDRAH